jgi:hypothetical protein
MLNQSREHRSVLDAIADWVRRYREAIGLRNELANCTSEQVAVIARDMGISPGELLSITAKGPHAADELPRYSVRSASIRRNLCPKILAQCAICSESASVAAIRVSASTISPRVQP